MQRRWSELDTANKIVKPREAQDFRIDDWTFRSHYILHALRPTWKSWKCYLSYLVIPTLCKHNRLFIAPAPPHPASRAVDGAKSRTPCSNSVVVNCTRRADSPHSIHQLTINPCDWNNCMPCYACLCCFVCLVFLRLSYIFTYVLSFWLKLWTLWGDVGRFIHVGLPIPVDVHQVEQRFRVLLRQLNLEVKLLQLVESELFESEQNTEIIVATICSCIYVYVYIYI